MPAFSARDELLAADLAAGMRQTEAAKKHGLNARTIRRKLSDPVFLALVNQHQEDIFKSSVRTLCTAMSEVAIVLRKLLRSQSEASQLKASALILENTADLVSLTELKDRLADLESQMPADRKWRPNS